MSGGGGGAGCFPGRVGVLLLQQQGKVGPGHCFYIPGHLVPRGGPVRQAGPEFEADIIVYL